MKLFQQPVKTALEQLEAALNWVKEPPRSKRSGSALWSLTRKRHWAKEEEKRAGVKGVHDFVSNRSFDPLRIAEYKSRMLLGFASGGIVMYFVSQIGVGDANEAPNGDEIIQLSAPVLAIIAGYNTDFIFQAIERMVAAILPKVGVASAKRAQSDKPSVHKVSVQSLTESLLAATDESDKVIIRSLLESARKNL